MLTFIFLVGLIWLIFKLIKIAVKMTWSISKIILSIVLFPMVLVFMAFSGMVTLALILMIIAAVVTR